MPSDLSAPFRAKILFLTAMVILFWLPAPITYLLVDHQEGIAGVTDREILIVMAAMLPVALTFAYWGFSVTCWLPGSSLAYPATILLAGGAGLPFLLRWMPSWFVTFQRNDRAYMYNEWGGIFGFNEFAGPLPTTWEGALFLAVIMPLAALIGAWITFMGFRKEGGAVRTALRGAPVLVLAMVLGWGWLSSREEVWAKTELACRNFSITDAWMGTDNRFAFLNATVRGRQRAVILDLEKEAMRKVSEKGSRFEPLAEDPKGKLVRMPNADWFSSPVAHDYFALRIFEEGKADCFLLGGGRAGIGLSLPNCVPFFLECRKQRSFLGSNG